MTRITGDHAVELFDANHNCAEAVMRALTIAWGLEIPFAVATAFGGGMARSGRTCGALTGALMALGARVGRQPTDQEGRDLVYKLAWELMDSFQATHGNTGCLELTGCLLADAGGHRRFVEDGIRQRICRGLVRYAAEKAGHLYQQHQTSARGLS
ncbi:MAG: C-GCAxxG-C-C family protein [Bacillota bacterium]